MIYAKLQCVVGYAIPVASSAAPPFGPVSAVTMILPNVPAMRPDMTTHMVAEPLGSGITMSGTSKLNSGTTCITYYDYNTSGSMIEDCYKILLGK